MFASFTYKICEFDKHTKFIVYEVIKNRQNNHIIPLHIKKNIFIENIILYLM